MSFRWLAHDLLCVLRLRTDQGSWILPDQLLACAYPRTNAALAALEAVGVQLVVNLHVRAQPPAALARFGLTELHLPTPDFGVPTAESLRRGVEAIERALAARWRVAVHCGAGRGRTGTLVACVLVARGSTPAEALVRVRRLRPGAVETRAQEAAIDGFDRWYRASLSEPPIERRG
jgi:atypical dual specificity phosphatase